MGRFLLYLYVVAVLWHRGTLSELDVPQLCRDESIDIPTMDPQYTNQLRLSELSDNINYLQELLDSNCSHILGRFLCISHLPRPNIVYNDVVRDFAGPQHRKPCLEVCRDVWQSCRSTAHKLGLSRTSEFNCNDCRYAETQDCLKAEDLYPPADQPLLNSVARFRNNSASLVFFPQSSNYLEELAVLIRYSDISGPKSNICRIRMSSPEYHATSCIQHFDSPEGYMLEMSLVNGFGEGPRMRYMVQAVEDNVKGPLGTGSTSISKVSYVSRWSCQSVAFEMCPNHTRAALPSPIWSGPAFVQTMELEEALRSYSFLLGMVCHESLQWFLCATYLPTCTEEGVVIPPCRETCFMVHQGCAQMLRYFSRITVPLPDCQNLPIRSSGQCMDAPGVLTQMEAPQLCKDEGIDVPTSDPLFLENLRLNDLSGNIHYLKGLLDSGCSDIIGRFLCLSHLPRPNLISHLVPLGFNALQFSKPCAEVCRDVWRNCRNAARELGLSRTPELDCKQYLPQSPLMCLTVEEMYPPADQPILNSVTRFRDNKASFVFFSPPSNPVQVFAVLIRYNETGNPKSKTCLLPDSPCIITFDRPDGYLLEMSFVNGFGEGPRMSYMLEPVEDDPEDPLVVGTSIYKVSYGSSWTCQNVAVEMCPNHTRAAQPNPIWPGQDAELNLRSYALLLATGCDDSLQWFLCAAYLPKCTEEGVVIPPCRETCFMVHQSCAHLNQSFGRVTLPLPDCQVLPTRSSGQCVYTQDGEDVFATPSVPILGQCEDITVPMCQSGLPYTRTLMPNFRNMTTQDEVTLRLPGFSPAMQLYECSPYIQRYYCAVFVPQCIEDGPSPTARVPCRELCEGAIGCTEHTPLGHLYRLVTTEISECEKLPSREDGDCYHGDLPTVAVHQCEDITIKVCQSNIQYETTAMPNYLNMTNQDDARLELRQFYPLMKARCSPYLRTFLCAAYVPRCISNPALRFPCRELCEEAKNGCSEVMTEYGFSWPDALRCEQMPRRETGSCFDGDLPVVAPNQCEDITIPLCRSNYIGYTKTAMPNYLHMTSQEDAGLEVQLFYPLVELQCSPYLQKFLCAAYAPRCYDDGSSSTQRTPCRELCEEARRGCSKTMERFGFSWPDELRCEKLPRRETGVCYDGGIPEAFLSLFSGEVDGGRSDNVPRPTKTVASRRYDAKDLGLPSMFRGWVDVQGQGAANDYCRVVSSITPPFLSCVLAGMQGEYNYNSTGSWFDAGYADTWYMRDVNQDGRDDYCRCVGHVPKTYISCLLADDVGFSGPVLDFQSPQGDCHKIEVNPFFGTP